MLAFQVIGIPDCRKPYMNPANSVVTATFANISMGGKVKISSLQLDFHAIW